MNYKILLLFAFIFSSFNVKAQDYLDDIMLQSFGWDEYAQTRITTEGSFYEYYNARAGNLKALGFDMIWLPPATASTGGVGYFPTEWNNFSKTSWGTESQLKKMLSNMNSKGIYPIADVVVNHRSGTTGWVDFTNPTWGCETICIDDDASKASYVGCRPSGAPDTGLGFDGSRDLDHTNSTVQNGVKDFLSKLKTLGFKGWRWDVAKGFSPVYFGNYIQSSQPYYSVGEYWDGDVNAVKNWINGTYGGGANVSGAFDFPLYYAMSGVMITSSTQTASNNYANLVSSNNMAGLAGQSGFSDKAVTFVDNHDTFVQGSAFTGSYITMAYAYILTHPGIPCVFAPHYFGGTYTKDGVSRTYSSYAAPINKLMAIRKAAGINANSTITVDKAEAGLYAAYIKKNANDTDPSIAVKIGPYSWTPTLGTGWVSSASGTNYTVWTKTAVNVAPVISVTPASGMYALGSNLSVTITATDDSGVAPTIRYTTDGSEPTLASPIYSSAINISTDTVVKAIAIDNLGLSSGVMERSYTFVAPKDIVVRFKPPTTTPNWASPKIHYWDYSPTNALTAANWNTPIDMTADSANPGWFKYTFPSIIKVSLLFRDGSATGTLGSTKTGDIVDVSQDTWYEWDPTNSVTYVKEVSVLGTNDSHLTTASVLELLQNPVKNGLLKVRYKNAAGGVFYLYDLNGKLIQSAYAKTTNGEEDFSVSGLPRGMYVLALKTEQGVASRKFMIQ